MALAMDPMGSKQLGGVPTGNSSGRRGSSQYHGDKEFRSPLWVFMRICVIIITILVLAVVVLIISYPITLRMYSGRLPQELRPISELYRAVDANVPFDVAGLFGTVEEVGNAEDDIQAESKQTTLDDDVAEVREEPKPPTRPVVDVDPHLETTTTTTEMLQKPMSKKQRAKEKAIRAQQKAKYAALIGKIATEGGKSFGMSDAETGKPIVFDVPESSTAPCTDPQGYDPAPKIALLVLAPFGANATSEWLAGEDKGAVHMTMVVEDLPYRSPSNGWKQALGGKCEHALEHAGDDGDMDEDERVAVALDAGLKLAAKNHGSHNPVATAGANRPRAGLLGRAKQAAEPEVLRCEEGILAAARASTPQAAVLEAAAKAAEAGGADVLCLRTATAGESGGTRRRRRLLQEEGQEQDEQDEQDGSTPMASEAQLESSPNPTSDRDQSSWIAHAQSFFKAYPRLGILGLGHSSTTGGGQFDKRFGRRHIDDVAKLVKEGLSETRCPTPRGKRRGVATGMCPPPAAVRPTACSSAPDAQASHNARTDLDGGPNVMCAPIQTRADDVARSCGAPPSSRFHFATRVAGPNEGGSAPICIRLKALKAAGGIDHLGHKRGAGAWAGALDYELGLLSLRAWRRGYSTASAVIRGAEAPPEHAWRAAKLAGKLADVRAKGQIVAHDLLYKLWVDHGTPIVRHVATANGRLDSFSIKEDFDVASILD